MKPELISDLPSQAQVDEVQRLWPVCRASGTVLAHRAGPKV
jgi:hypothetical protein